MNTTNYNLLNDTRDLLQNAQAFHEYHYKLEVMSDCVISDHDIRAQEYRDGLKLLNTTIIENRFVNQDARNAVHDAISAYRHMIPPERKLTAKRIDAYLERVISTEDNLFNGSSF